MKFNRLILLGVAVISLSASVILGISAANNIFNANALSTKDFKPGRIIDDSIFYNAKSMNVQQIQEFLDKQIPNCDVWGTQKATEKNRGDITHAQYAQLVGWPSPPYTCLNKYHENPTTKETSFEKGGGAFSGGLSAAQIIYNASQTYGINPQVLLVLLKKESLGPITSDSWPLKSQYKYAMGYACPDSGPNYSAACDDSKAGLYQQVNLAAWQLKKYKDNPNDYRYKIGWNDIQYAPSPSCGTKRVYIENIATLSLYIYTPYTPNDASLANYPGTANCGSYGNRNFFMFFNEWFNTTRVDGYSWEGVSGQYYADSQKTRLLNPQNLSRSQYVYVSLKFKNTGAVTWKKNDVRLAVSKDRNSELCTYSWISCSRIATLTEQEVKPGEIGTFETWILTPDTSGPHRMDFGAVIEGVTWLNDIGAGLGFTTGAYRVAVTDQISLSTKNTLNIGEHLLSPDRRTSLYLNHQGALALYKDGEAIWTTPTGGSFLVIQGDGNLVLYSKNGRVVWVNGSSLAAGLEINDEGNLYLVNSQGGIISDPIATAETSERLDYLKSDSLLFTEQLLSSKTEKTRLIVQGDGNMVSYKEGRPVWASNSFGGNFLVQQGDGNLVLYDIRGKAVWSSNRSGASVKTYVQDDGNIVSYSSKGVLWAAR